VKLNPGLPKRKQLKKFLFTNIVGLNSRKKLMKCYIWRVAVYGYEIWALRKICQIYLECIETWC